MSKKLAAKANLIQLPPIRSTSNTSSLAEAKEEAAVPDQPAIDQPFEGAPALPRNRLTPSGPDGRAKTAPGSMAIFLASQSAAIKEAEELRIKLKSYDGALAVRAIDPRRIRPSKWANRHADAFSDGPYVELRNDIAAAGTNVQPICVRPLSSDGEEEYELVFGHRRHRACLDLGLPVQALITEMEDRKLFEAMERENRGRKNLSAWEQGRMYQRALDNGLYSSQRKLAEAINVDLALISKSVALSRLPQVVIDAFGSPLDVQFRWAQPLSEALQKDPDGTTSRAKSLATERGNRSAKQVMEFLTQTESPASSRMSGKAEQRVGKAGKGAVVRHEDDGRVTVRFDPGVLTAKRESALMAWLRANLGAGPATGDAEDPASS